MVARVITGVGNGLNTSTVPTWQSEISKAHQRGRLVMIEGMLITAGIMLSYWINYGEWHCEPFFPLLQHLTPSRLCLDWRQGSGLAFSAGLPDRLFSHYFLYDPQSSGVSAMACHAGPR